MCFFFCRWYIVRKTAAREILADYRSEVYRLIAEIDAATDRDSLLVEERIKILRKLLDDTDRRISVYMRELQRSRNGEAMYAKLGQGIRAALDSRPQEDDTELQRSDHEQHSPLPPEESTRTGERVDEQRRYGVDQEKAVVTTKPEGSPTPHSPLPTSQLELITPQEASLPASVKPRSDKKRSAPKPKLKTQIAELSAQGLSPQKIASRLHLSLAEVDLALSLQRPNE